MQLSLKASLGLDRVGGGGGGGGAGWGVDLGSLV